LTALEERVRALEQMKRPVVLIDGETKEIIDQEEYGNGESILLDIRQLKR
jgi:hypothetical protein